jgi:DNA-binding GntR family transcriptional regulator
MAGRRRRKGSTRNVDDLRDDRMPTGTPRCAAPCTPVAHSRIMADLSERRWDRSDLFISTVGGPQLLSKARHDRNHDHNVIRDAIRSQNTEVARVSMESHIVGTLDLFGPHLVPSRGA